MHFHAYASTIFVATAVIATPVHLVESLGRLLSPRQLGSLGGIIAGIMSQGSGTSPFPAAAPIVTTIPKQDCADAISKIDAALDTSEKFMKTNGNQVTIKEIQAVLVILSDSLADDCGEGRMFPRDIVSTEVDAEAMAGASMDTDMAMMDVSTDADVDGDAAVVEVRDISMKMKTCSDCERQLYSIVKSLYKILSLAEEAEIRVAATASVALSVTKVPIMPTTTSLTAAPFTRV